MTKEDGILLILSSSFCPCLTIQATTHGFALCLCVVSLKTLILTWWLVHLLEFGRFIGPLGNKSSRAYHRSSSNLKCRNKQCMESLQSMVGSRKGYHWELWFLWILLTTVTGTESNELRSPRLLSKDDGNAYPSWYRNFYPHACQAKAPKPGTYIGTWHCHSLKMSYCSHRQQPYSLEKGWFLFPLLSNIHE